MSRLFSLTIGAALAAVAVMFCAAGPAEAQVKPADPTSTDDANVEFFGHNDSLENRRTIDPTPLRVGD